MTAAVPMRLSLNVDLGPKFGDLDHAPGADRVDEPMLCRRGSMTMMIEEVSRSPFLATSRATVDYRDLRRGQSEALARRNGEDRQTDLLFQMPSVLERSTAPGRESSRNVQVGCCWPAGFSVPSVETTVPGAFLMWSKLEVRRASWIWSSRCSMAEMSYVPM